MKSKLGENALRYPVRMHCPRIWSQFGDKKVIKNVTSININESQKQ